MKAPLHPDVAFMTTAVVRANTKDPTGPAQLQVELVYSHTDPFAVWLNIAAPGRRTAVWAVSRDLVAAGCAAPSGDGDVRIRPDGDGVVVELETDAGWSVFVVPRKHVVKFLKATFRVVRQGRETVDVDEAIARMRPTGWVL